jgi:ubiquitin-conjugating enzyme E2 J2
MTENVKLSTLAEKRLHNEIKDLIKNKSDCVQAIQDETNKLIFYFLLRGDKDSDFKGGYYIGKIILHPDYPNKPGDFMMLTPNGRFSTDRKICLSNTGYHSESWNPLWSIRNSLLGIYSIWMDDKENGISHIHDSPATRRKYASDSMAYNLKHYKEVICKFDQFIREDGTIKTEEEQKEALVAKKKKKEKKEEA